MGSVEVAKMVLVGLAKMDSLELAKMFTLGLAKIVAVGPAKEMDLVLLGSCSKELKLLILQLLPENPVPHWHL